MVLRRMINDPQRLAVPMSCVETILRCCIGNETLDDAVGVRGVSRGVKALLLVERGCVLYYPRFSDFEGMSLMT